MENNCQACNQSFLVTPEHRKMLDTVAPVINGTTHTLPDPTVCKDCRHQRRLTHRNDSNYYKNNCAACKKDVISIYSADSNYPVYCHDCFWSDQWDPASYGKEFDFNRPFFEQFNELKNTVPRLCIFNTQSENSEYTVHSSKNKNGYMCSSNVGCEDVYFSDWAINCTTCSDLFMCFDMTCCYNCNNSRQCYNSDYLDLCTDVTDSYLNFDCNNSKNLLGCVSLKNKEYHMLNKEVTKEEFETTLKRLKTDRAFCDEFNAKYQALKQSIPKRAAWNINTENSVGDYLKNTKNAHYCFNSMDIEDCMYSEGIVNNRNCCDITRGSGMEGCYECEGIVELNLSSFCNLTYQCHSLLYCDNGHSSDNCFGCFSFKSAQYCILNKQYAKEEYEQLVPRIIEHMKKTGEWGEFFPTTISSFCYNQTKAMAEFPLSKEGVLQRGWQWSETENPDTSGINAIEADLLPEDINTVPDDMLNYVIKPKNDGKLFRLIPQELNFYRSKGLPIPRMHPNQRQQALLARQNKTKLYSRTCDHCLCDIQTTYSPDAPETVYCDTCYLSEVY